MTNDTSAAPLEIERKFLIRMPDAETLRRNAVERIEIMQIYLVLTDGADSRRIRRSRTAEAERFYYTEKVRLTDMTRIEREREITAAEWDELSAQADPRRRPVEKTRWCVPWGGHTLEIDVFPFWDDRAFCEIELAAEDETAALPDWIRVVREVTADRRYTNYSLALHIPEESI